MTPRIFSLITATLFTLMALLHVLRLLRGWQLTIGDVVVPLWVSWIGLAIAGYLAYQGVKVSRANEVAALRRKQTIGSVNKVLVFLVRVSASARTGFDQVTLWPQNTQGFNSWPEELLQRNASLMLKHAPFASSMRYVNPSP
jgi:hypothetical protein